MDNLTRTIAARFANGSLQACRIMQVTPLLVSFDGGSSSVPGDKIAGGTYTVGSVDNARALMDSPNKPLVFPIG